MVQPVSRMMGTWEVGGDRLSPGPGHTDLLLALTSTERMTIQSDREMDSC